MHALKCAGYLAAACLLLFAGGARADTAQPVGKSDDLIVGSIRGLEAWRRDGSGRRMVSKGPALHPRWLEADAVLVVHPNTADDLARGGHIERIVLANGARSRVADLPPFACVAGPQGTQDVMRLDIQEETDFLIDRTKGWACMTLMDRNINASSLSLNVRISLKSGKVTRHLSTGEEICQAPTGVTTGENRGATCAFAFPPETIDPQPMLHPFSFKAGNVLQSIGGVSRKVLRLRGYEKLSLSPSGHWAVLHGDAEEGDYIHRSLVLLDRVTGKVFPIREEAGAWPDPLKPAGKKAATIKVPIVNTIGVVGETDVRWLGTSAQDEVLVVDSLVITPGRPSFTVDGAIAE